MTDIGALKKRIKDTGMTIVYIANKSGILRETLYNRMKTGDFKVSEISALSKTLRLTIKERDEIFFAEQSELKSTNERNNGGEQDAKNQSGGSVR